MSLQDYHHGGYPIGNNKQPPSTDYPLFGDEPLFGGGGGGSPSSYLLPDLVPDTGFSPPTQLPPPIASFLPPMAFGHSAAYQRSSSVPLHPRPVRRRTQEFKDQQSFVPTLYGNGIGTTPMHNAFAFASPAAASSSTQPTTTTSNGYGGSNWTPATDHPLSIPEQQDLLDRVRRDLYGVDLDNIKGPLRALALSSIGDLPPAQQAVPQYGHHLGGSAAAQAQLDREEMMRKTVSPQEAFLDYEDVDHRLHPSGGSYPGMGASLFAPLPRQTSLPAATRTPPPPLATATTATTPNSLSPSRASSPAVLNPLSTSPHATSTLSSGRKPHPFAVPQNAVSWAADDRRQASGEGDDDGGSDEGSEEPSPAAVVKQEESDDEGAADDDGIIGQFDEDTAPPPPAAPAFHSPAPASSSSSRSTYLPPPVHSTASLFAPPAPARTHPSHAASTATSAQHHEHMRPSARRALDLLQHVDDPDPAEEQEGREQDDAEGGEEDADGELEEEEVVTRGSRRSASRGRGATEEDDDGEYVPTTTASGRPARSTAGRKRSRTPFAEEDDESEDGGGEFHASGESDSDAPAGATGSTASAAQHKRNSTSAPNKRRRRVPNPAATASSSSSAIRCPHVNTDGTTCGVVFRRPYDLARHRETIHGETAEGKVARKMEWVCKGCGGTFSRKDALIRHARIRGHKSGI